MSYPDTQRFINYLVHGRSAAHGAFPDRNGGHEGLSGLAQQKRLRHWPDGAVTMQALNQPSKRTLLKLAAVWPWFAGCSNPVGAADDAQRRFKGIGIVLVVDAVLGAEMRGAVITDDLAAVILSPALVSRRNKKFMALGGTRVPLTVRAVWRENGHYDYSHATWYGGTVVGDYTVAVAERIPNDILADIRAHGGALRLKFRLKPDGVLLGWDIERGLPIPGCDPAQNATCTGTYFFAPGGDFLETRY